MDPTTALGDDNHENFMEGRMKRAIVFALAFLMIFAIGLSAKVRVVPGVYSTENGDFYTKFWKEMFKGGGPGQLGNTLQALGEGFIFNQARLATVEAGGFTVGTDPFTYAYKTTYTGGKMTLNPGGPWCDRGALKGKNVTAVNYSTQDPPLTGILKFHLTIEGDFANAPGFHFVIDAMYEGQPEVKYDEMTGLPSFQRGMDYDVIITITYK
jgi:hypothetical protein